MLGNSAEFFAAEPRSSNCVRVTGQAACADWTIGEDVFLPADVVPGFRNMADPEEDNDPDDYSERLLGTADRGFVHSNSAISNHAFYLLVNGGMNASCAAPATHDAAHCGGRRTRPSTPFRAQQAVGTPTASQAAVVEPCCCEP